MPGSCDGCGDPFTISHALDCRNGGLVISCHNTVRHALGDITDLTHIEVLREPTVREANGKVDTTTLVADLEVRGMWQHQTVALIDVRVIDLDVPFHID